MGLPRRLRRLAMTVFLRHYERKRSNLVFPVITRTSCPLIKALITLCRGEISERICLARTVTERKVHLALREKKRRSNLTGERTCQIRWRFTKQSVRGKQKKSVVHCKGNRRENASKRKWKKRGNQRNKGKSTKKRADFYKLRQERKIFSLRLYVQSCEKRRSML